jgi:hypothetical protein
MGAPEVTEPDGMNIDEREIARLEARIAELEAGLRCIADWSLPMEDTSQTEYGPIKALARSLLDEHAQLARDIASREDEETDDDGHISREMMRRFHAPTPDQPEPE